MWLIIGFAYLVIGTLLVHYSKTEPVLMVFFLPFLPFLCSLWLIKQWFEFMGIKCN